MAPAPSRSGGCRCRGVAFHPAGKLPAKHHLGAGATCERAAGARSKSQLSARGTPTGQRPRGTGGRRGCARPGYSATLRQCGHQGDAVFSDFQKSAWRDTRWEFPPESRSRGSRSARKRAAMSDSLGSRSSRPRPVAGRPLGSSAACAISPLNRAASPFSPRPVKPPLASGRSRTVERDTGSPARDFSTEARASENLALRDRLPER
jgi:hypothetical protein